MVCPTDGSTAAMVLPHFPVEIAAPDLSPWLAGNTGIPGVHSFAAHIPGPHVAVFAITHGNEIAGAIVLDRLLRIGVRPALGRLSLVFANPEAYARFDPQQPTTSRYVDEDLNRLWDDATLRGTRQSQELSRARALRPLVDTVDVLLDLHSMLWASEALILCGLTERSGALARAIGSPPLVVADAGHVSGKRMIDYDRFSNPAGQSQAILVEAGQHWRADTVTTAQESTEAVLRLTGILSAGHTAPDRPARFARVTQAVTASSSQFSFVKDYRGGDIVPRRNTVIALDGEIEIRTPYDDCLLVMPSLRPSRGHTAVRLARFV